MIWAPCFSIHNIWLRRLRWTKDRCIWSSGSRRRSFDKAFGTDWTISCIWIMSKASTCPNVTVVPCPWIKLIELESFTCYVFAASVSTSFLSTNLVLGIFEIVGMASDVRVLICSPALPLCHFVPKIITFGKLWLGAFRFLKLAILELCFKIHDKFLLRHLVLSCFTLDSSYWCSHIFLGVIVLSF